MSWPELKTSLQLYSPLQEYYTDQKRPRFRLPGPVTTVRMEPEMAFRKNGYSRASHDALSPGGRDRENPNGEEPDEIE